ncbi:MAG TPA: hydroxymethylglutaryl-CoA reductase, degradative [Thermococcus sp.]|nr:MAG: hydroxymethylglutaryl-CoA reductase, degradative [Thermococci archaeon]HDH44147.1 hydroxymethylglutaryl-CoA reductase, degradative [Thermococcus sp.]
MEKTSRISGFHKLTVEERLQKVKEFAGLSDEEISLFKKTGALEIETADRMIENVIGTFPLPYGIATNFIINNKEIFIPMVIEEPSVVAALSNAARMARSGGGFFASSTGPFMIAQIQVVGLSDPFGTKMLLYEKKEEILRLANEKDPVLVSLGGGAKDVEVRIIETVKGTMLVIHLIVDVRDAMGANAVNTMAEAIAPHIESWTGGKVYLRILSNLADKRLVRARTLVKKEAIGGEDVVDGIIYAWAFADADPYRAATHNKGIMNGISAVVIATGNDFRAVEAGAHSYASRNGRYRSLTRWEKDKEGNLIGTIELPMAVGIVGGATKIHPLARISIKILGVKTASELAEIIGAVGLAQNLAALRVLATEGVQRGHMALHARNVAVTAGAKGDEVEIIVKKMVEEGKVNVERAKEILKEIRER